MPLELWTLKGIATCSRSRLLAMRVYIIPSLHIATRHHHFYERECMLTELIFLLSQYTFATYLVINEILYVSPPYQSDEKECYIVVKIFHPLGIILTSSSIQSKVVSRPHSYWILLYQTRYPSCVETQLNIVRNNWLQLFGRKKLLVPSGY